MTTKKLTQDNAAETIAEARNELSVVDHDVDECLKVLTLAAEGLRHLKKIVKNLEQVVNSVDTDTLPKRKKKRSVPSFFS
jgi:hypothetical protein